MEKIRRAIRLFWADYGKLLLQVIGVIALVIFVIQSLNEYVKLENEEQNNKTIVTQEQSEKEQIQKKQDKEYKEVISTFINFCNEQNVEGAYKMLSADCMQNKFLTIDEFKQEYLNKIFNTQKDYEIILEENNIYKVVFLEDILQAGSLENRKRIEDYYSVEENVLGNKTVNINLYNSIKEYQ